MNDSEIKFIDSISYRDIALYGGKGASLGELANMGVNVPDAFVLSTNISSKNIKDFEREILKSFDALETQFVAVRSSATREDSLDSSFAGQFDTFLNVERGNLLSSILRCYKSLKSDRIVSYCKSKKINPASIKIAVVIQKMIQSEISGIAFSANPINNNREEIMIEAGFGLGEYVVSGIITPDKYIFNKKTGKLKEIKINYQEFKLSCANRRNKKVEVALEKRNAVKLPTKYFSQLLKTIKLIEKRYKKPVDIEWAIEHEDIYITQARPITTLSK